MIMRLTKTLAVLGCTACFASSAHAATLSISGSGASVGQTMSVSILVGADNGEVLNAVATDLKYPTDKLSLTSLSKSGSIISLWAEEPNFSNATGIASLEGIIPNPGYMGQGGRVITATFRVLAPGEATLSFSNASVLANDGLGTDILRAAIPRTFTLTAASPKAPPAPVRPTQPSSEATTDTVSTTTATSSAAQETVDVNADLLPIPEPSFASRVGIALLYLLAAVGLLAFLIAAYIGLSRLLAAERKRQHEQKNIVDRSFALLKSDIEKHIAALKKSEGDKSLTKKEVAFLESFEDDLKTVEGIVQKRLKD